MNSYFFIPANKRKFLDRIAEIEATEMIIDLEDALFNSDIEEGVSNILDYSLSTRSFIRLTYDPHGPAGQLDYLRRIVEKGYNRFVLPKIESLADLDQVVDQIMAWSEKAPEIIVLIENAKAMLHLPGIMQHQVVTGAGLGSHDYCQQVGMEHTFDNLYWARMEMLNTAKACGKEAIDIASMNISDQRDFEGECRDAFSKGFDGKFIIHPWQLHIFNGLMYYSQAEVELALAVKKYIQEIGGEKHFTIAKVEGKVIEKPHLKRINQILKTSGNGSI